MIVDKSIRVIKQIDFNRKIYKWAGYDITLEEALAIIALMAPGAIGVGYYIFRIAGAATLKPPVEKLVTPAVILANKMAAEKVKPTLLETVVYPFGKEILLQQCIKRINRFQNYQFFLEAVKEDGEYNKIINCTSRLIKNYPALTKDTIRLNQAVVDMILLYNEASKFDNM